MVAQTTMELPSRRHIFILFLLQAIGDYPLQCYPKFISIVLFFALSFNNKAETKLRNQSSINISADTFRLVNGF